MSYRCDSCREAVPHGQPKLVHRLIRRDGSIARELGVCAECQRKLASGIPINPKPRQVAEAKPTQAHQMMGEHKEQQCTKSPAS